MDITDTLAPKSDQMDYEDLMTAERTFTIKNVRKGPSAEQPVQIDLEEFDRPWRPAKSMRRVLAMAWGSDASKYAGRQVRLFGDATVKWAGQEVGGIRIRALSHIPEALTVALTVTRGKRAPFIVQPLDPPKPQVDESGRDWLVELADTQGDVDAIEALGKAAHAAHASGKILTVIRSAYTNAKAEQTPKALDPSHPDYVEPSQS